MKKTTMLAVSLVLAAAISAVWFAPDLKESYAPVRPEPLVRRSTTGSHETAASDEHRVDPQPIESPAPADLPAVPPPASAPASLFSEVRTMGSAYQNANIEAAGLISRYGIPGIVTRSRIVELNVAAVERLFDLALQNPQQLSEAIDVTIFPELSCIVTETDPVVSVEGEGLEMIMASCSDRYGANSGRITMSRNLVKGTFAYSIDGRRADHRLTALEGEGDYALVHELDQALIPRQTGDDVVGRPDSP